MSKDRYGNTPLHLLSSQFVYDNTEIQEELTNFSRIMINKGMYNGKNC